MPSQVIFLLLLFVAVALETIADILFKASYLQNRSVLIVAGVVLYTVGTVIWALSLRYEFLSKAISIFTVLNLIAVLLAGFVIFNEHLSLLNKVGIGLGIISVILMQL